MPVTKKLDELGVNAPLRVVGNYGNELGGMYNISSLEGYDAMHKRRYGEFISYLSNGQLNIPSRSVAILDKHGPHTQDALELLGVSYYLHKFSDGRFSWAYPFGNIHNINLYGRMKHMRYLKMPRHILERFSRQSTK